MKAEPANPVTKSKPFFRHDPVASILLLAAVFFASQIAAVFLVSLYPAIRDWTQADGSAWLDSITGRFIYVVAAEVLAIYMTLQLVKAARVSAKRIGLVKPRLRDAGWALIAYGLYFLVYMAVIIVASSLIPAVDLQQEQQIGFENAWLTSELAMTFIALVVMVPLAEEVMFRGFLFSSLRAKYKFWPATIVTGLLFGIAHLQFGSGAPLLWVAAIDTFILSCFLCYLREEYKSIWPAAFLHAIKNCVAFMVLFSVRIFV